MRPWALQRPVGVGVDGAGVGHAPLERRDDQNRGLSPVIVPSFPNPIALLPYCPRLVLDYVRPLRWAAIFIHFTGRATFRRDKMTDWFAHAEEL